MPWVHQPGVRLNHHLLGGRKSRRNSSNLSQGGAGHQSAAHRLTVRPTLHAALQQTTANSASHPHQSWAPLLCREPITLYLDWARIGRCLPQQKEGPPPKIPAMQRCADLPLLFSTTLVRMMRFLPLLFPLIIARGVRSMYTVSVSVRTSAFPRRCG